MCGRWGKQQKGGPLFVCIANRQHQFYLHDPMECGNCGSGYLVVTGDGRAAYCDVCPAKVRRGGR
ncbi:hypothetical protein [Lentzea albida]|nr:hypothetical protein [Lentzea albida]